MMATAPEPDDLAAERAWVERWKRAGPELARVKRRELGAMTYEQQVQALESVLDLGFRLARPRTTSGLVEQQRLFKKARR